MTITKSQDPQAQGATQEPSNAAERRNRGYGLSLKRDLFGRRGGKTLRPAQRSRLERLLPQLAVDVSVLDALDPAEIFAETRARRYWLEIGFGGGEHLAWQAQHSPDVGIIGAEFYLNAVSTALRHIEEAEVAPRCRVHLGDGRDFMDALRPGSLERIFILHPDPWRKARHWDRRIISAATLDRAAELLQPGGELRMATDHVDYQFWMMRIATQHPRFAWSPLSHQAYTHQAEDWPTTRYQAKAAREGRPPVFCTLIRR